MLPQDLIESVAICDTDLRHIKIYWTKAQWKQTRWHDAMKNPAEAGSV